MEKISWIFVIHEKHEIKYTTKLFTYTVYDYRQNCALKLIQVLTTHKILNSLAGTSVYESTVYYSLKIMSEFDIAFEWYGMYVDTEH